LLLLLLPVLILLASAPFWFGDHAQRDDLL